MIKSNELARSWSLDNFLLAFGVFKNGVINAAESESYDVDQVQEEINQLAETELSVSIQHI